MEIKKSSLPTFGGSLFIGLEKGYTGEKITEEDVISSLSRIQKELSDSQKIYLSASVSRTKIVLNDQNEDHLKIDFINYPKFPLRKDELKKEILDIAEKLMGAHSQNRMLAVFTDETVMLEKSDEIDPRI